MIVFPTEIFSKAPAVPRDKTITMAISLGLYVSLNKVCKQIGEIVVKLKRLTAFFDFNTFLPKISSFLRKYHRYSVISQEIKLLI